MCGWDAVRLREEKFGLSFPPGRSPWSSPGFHFFLDSFVTQREVFRGGSSAFVHFVSLRPQAVSIAHAFYPRLWRELAMAHYLLPQGSEKWLLALRACDGRR